MDSHAEQAAKALASDLASWKSVEIRTRMGIQNKALPAGNSQAFDAVLERYIETAAGRRLCEHRTLNGDALDRLSMYYGDGAKFANVDYRRDDPETQQVVFINRQFWMEDRSDRKQVPPPLLYFYVGREPLHQALPKSTYLGQDKVIGRDCEIFLFPQVQWMVPQDQVFYLDKTTGVPLKVDAYRDAAARERNKPLWSWTVESLGEVDGHFVPLKSSEVSFDREGVEVMARQIDVESIAFNKDYPASMFWPVVQPGVTVIDSIANKMSVTPGQPKPELKKEAASPARPTYADPPRDWSATASNVSLVLGGAVLLAGIVLWRRRG